MTAADFLTYVVTRNRLYLVCIHEDCLLHPVYSPHVYDAARIRNANDARRVANRIGGNVHRFNPITGDVT